MGEKQVQQHRQHFNLSEQAKQKLEELTARHYPGKQRRQSQLVEDLITEAYAKERSMNIVTTAMSDPDPDRLASVTHAAIGAAQIEAMRMEATAVFPEHLLLSLLDQGNTGALIVLRRLNIDVRAMRGRIVELLSLTWTERKRQWYTLEEQYKNNELVLGRVIDHNKGGLIVDVSGIRGFIPISQILNLKREEVASGGEDQETAAKLQGMKDKDLQLKIIEINRPHNRLILSERLAVQEWRQRRREELLNELKPGEVRRGVVSQLASFGAFIDLGGADGLVHISQIAWSPINHPSEILTVGQEVEVQVLSVDKEKKKIALSIKRAEVDQLAIHERTAPIPAEPETGLHAEPHVEEHRGADEMLMRSVEQILADTKQTALPGLPGYDVASESLSLSKEAQECIDWAVAFAKNELVYPEHLLLGVLQHEYVQALLSALLPSAETLKRFAAGLVGDEGIRRQESTCPSCKRPIQPQWKHCVFCGASLAATCSYCGAPYPEVKGARFCFECGKLLNT